MTTKVEDVASGLLAGFVVGLIVGLAMLTALVVKLNSDGWRSEAVEHGYAHYNMQTGYWQWNNDPDAVKQMKHPSAAGEGE